jgi:tRNA(fMet)-specific endonuclease VapC
VVSLYALDTDVLTLYRFGHPMISLRVRAALQAGKLAVTVISAEEQLTGWYSMMRRAKQRSSLALAYQSLADTIALLTLFPILSFPVSAIARYEQLKAMRLNVAAMDLRIAAITLDAGCTLVTRNTRDFRRVPGLMLEDWSV